MRRYVYVAIKDRRKYAKRGWGNSGINTHFLLGIFMAKTENYPIAFSLAALLCLSANLKTLRMVGAQCVCWAILVFDPNSMGGCERVWAK